MQRQHGWILALGLGVVYLAATGFAQPGGKAEKDDKTDKPDSNPVASRRAETELEEKLLGVRRDYRNTLAELYERYRQNGKTQEAKEIEEELRGYHRIIKRITDIEIPGPNLRVGEPNLKANELYRKAMSYKNSTTGMFAGESEAFMNLRRAELLLQELLNNYPGCNKISDAAYQLAEIYESRYFKQYRAAAVYYERAAQWNRNIGNDARIRAARIYDKLLSQRDKAIALYREVLIWETNPAYTQEAEKRLSELGAAAK